MAGVTGGRAVLSSGITSCPGHGTGRTREQQVLNQIANVSFAGPVVASTTPVVDSPAEKLRALALVTEALEAMVDADSLALDERLVFIDEFERETDSVLAGLLAEAVSSKLPPRSFRALCSAARDCCAALLLAHRSCAGLSGHEACRGAIGHGIIRGGARFLKWQGLARGPAHGALWAWVDAALDMLRASAGDVASHSGGALDEPFDLVAVLATLSAGYDRVSLRAAPALDALVCRLMPQLVLSDQPTPDYALVFEPGSCSPPARPAMRRTNAGRAHYFSVGSARDSVLRCKSALMAGKSPASVGFPELQADQLLGALKHLARCWSPDATRRRGQRHVVTSDLYLVHGLEAIQFALCDGLPPALSRCRLVDISKHGAKVLTTSRRGARLDIGHLVAVRPLDATDWHVGQVRRVWYENEAEISVGIETLAAHAVLAHLDDGRQAHDVVAWGGLGRGQSLRVILPSGWSSEVDTLFLSVNKALHKLRLESRAVLNDDAVLGVCRVL